MSAKRRYVREGDYLDDETTIVAHGGLFDPGILRVDAERYHAVYSEDGISVFATRDATVDELAQAVPLVRFEILPGSIAKNRHLLDRTVA